MFSNAKTFVKPASSKSKTREIAVEGIREIGALKLIGENIESIQKTLTDELKSYAINEVYLAEGRRTGTVPTNFRATEETTDRDGKVFTSHGSVQLRPKSNRQVLRQEEIELFDTHSIPYKEHVEASVPETFIINPAYAENIELLGQIEAALSGIKGLPADLFLKQEAKKTWIVSEATLPAIFKLAAEKVKNVFKIDVPTFKSLVATATAPAVTPNFGSTDLKLALNVVSGLVDLSVEARAAEPAKAEPVKAEPVKAEPVKTAGVGLMSALKASLAAEQAKAPKKKAAKAA